MNGYCECCEFWQRIQQTAFGTCVIGHTDEVNDEFMWRGCPACEDFLRRDATTIGFCPHCGARVVDDGNE